LTTKTKDWLLLNAIECWLYYCDEKFEYSTAYKELRDEYRVLVASKDAPVNEQPAPKRTRSRSTK